MDDNWKLVGIVIVIYVVLVMAVLIFVTGPEKQCPEGSVEVQAYKSREIFCVKGTKP